MFIPESRVYLHEIPGVLLTHTLYSSITLILTVLYGGPSCMLLLCAAFEVGMCFLKHDITLAS